ncbi:MAG: hypothetical protein COV59_00325 [Candidatus Magasanikbacteria bacterium CG11_big_fil_rev_8_21_14_0_20_39_34]|uniref:PKD domain-containing protein n=1 Tax=Candidatus Magasanikbacteria bacterium CG11_big_fil_rev_8_21_14_0_20_39_34 TaxID=1974653 RepID=A0A2H0N6Q5_9BACT|nr:MAG: hypothetical protein COV59_00325 [Candidatus Magasanikbacteria bacterium CG11_big_fil_rev_8_21_14_0_20_39_34]
MKIYRRGLFFAFLLPLGAIFLFTLFSFQKIFVTADGPNFSNHIVISEVSTKGDTSSKDEYVELYNPTNELINLSGISLYKFTATKIQSEDKILIANLDNQSIPSHGFFLVAHQDYVIANSTQDNYVAPDFVYGDSSSTVSIADHNTLFLEDSSEVIDLVGFGNILSYEEAAAQNPTTGKSIERFPTGSLGNGQDTNNNANDFLRNDRSPQNSQSAPLPYENHPPQVYVTSNLSNIYAGESVSFDASLSSDPDGDTLTFFWDFNDSHTTTTEQATIQHVFSTPGDYLVSVTVSDTKGQTDTKSLLISVEGRNGVPQPVGTPLKINEFLSNPTPSEYEWVEIYNAGLTPIDITGFSLKDNVRTTYLDGVLQEESFLIVTSSNRFNNSGDIIELKDRNEKIIDRLYYGSYTDAEHTDNTTNAPAPETAQSGIRLPDGFDTDRDSTDFSITTQPTPGSPNVFVPIQKKQTNTKTPATPPASGSYQEQKNTFHESDVVINEIVSDPTDGQVEFIEFYNTQKNNIYLGGWWIEDGGATRTLLEDRIILPHDFYVLENPRGRLNNEGDLIKLYDKDGQLIDSLGYGELGAAPIAHDPSSLARKKDGIDTNYDEADFVVTKIITKGKANSIQEEKENMSEKTSLPIQENGVIHAPLKIIRFSPNPVGQDSENEFIEIQNTGELSFDVTGFKLADASAKQYTIHDLILLPQESHVFWRSETGIALNNSGEEEVKILSPSGNIIHQINYNKTIQEGEVYIFHNGLGGWVKNFDPHSTTTPENLAPNIVISIPKNLQKNTHILLDASDTTDPENDPLEFEWHIDSQTKEGELVEFMFDHEGLFSGTLLVHDGFNTSSEAFLLSLGENFGTGGYNWADPATLIISEIMPNPYGDDEAEFIELFNPNEDDMDLSGLQLDDVDGGSKPFPFPTGTILKGNDYKVFGRGKTGLVLNNDSDTVRILDQKNMVIQSTSYNMAKEGYAFVYKSYNQYVWTNSPTPGKQNVFTFSVPPSSTKKTQQNFFIKATLENLHNADIGDKVIVEGRVAALPGTLGSQIFYIQNESSGVQVYMYKKDFPNIHIGDMVEVSGEISVVSGETRVKISDKKDIKVISSGHTDLFPLQIEIGNIVDTMVGKLVKLSGEITELKGSQMYLDDGTSEMKIYFKKNTGITKSFYHLGNRVSVTGIVSKRSNEFQLLPRSTEDILILDPIEKTIRDSSSETITEPPEAITEKYLTATAGGLTSILIGLLARARGTMALNFLKKISSSSLSFVKRWRG